LRTHLEKISLDLEEEKELWAQLDTENNIRRSYIDEELCACFKDCHKAFDRVNLTKLMQMLKVTGVDWREIIAIRKLHMYQRVKIKLN
jgi:hypothetical protein